MLGLFIFGGITGAWALHRGARHGAAKLADSFGPIVGVIESLAGPMYLAALAIGVWGALQYFWLPAPAFDIAMGFLVSISIGALFWFLWNICPGLSAIFIQFIRIKLQHIA